jgi:hypothetical protein
MFDFGDGIISDELPRMLGKIQASPLAPSKTDDHTHQQIPLAVYT